MTVGPPGEWRSRRVVVAGGTGFLGSAMVERLRVLGAEVVSCSRREGVDLRDRAQAESFLLAQRPDAVFNFAANQGGVEYQRLCPAEILHDNALIQVHTMEAARLAGVRRYVNILAGCIYPGDPERGLLRESEIFDGPLHESADNYGMTKRLAFMQAKHYSRQYGFPVTSVILANSYGPGDHFEPDRSHALSALLRRFFEAKRDGASSVEVWGSGRAQRDWIFRDDAIAGVLLAAERWTGEHALNIATGRGVTTRELAEAIRDAVGYGGDIVYNAEKPEGPLRKVLDTTEMERRLGWTPPTSLRDGVARTLAWFAAHDVEAVAR